MFVPKTNQTEYKKKYFKFEGAIMVKRKQETHMNRVQFGGLDTEIANTFLIW